MNGVVLVLVGVVLSIIGAGFLYGLIMRVGYDPLGVANV